MPQAPASERGQCLADSPGHHLINQPKFPNQGGLNAEMIPEKAPKKDVYHAPEELQKVAHVSSYEQYMELYLKSTESPDGESGLAHAQVPADTVSHQWSSARTDTCLSRTHLV